MSSKIIISIVSIIVLFSPVLANATHGHWTDRYTNAAGISCCGVRDCIVVPMRILAIQDETIIVDIPSHQTTMTISRQSYHASEDNHDYWCAINKHKPPTSENTRCVFIAVGS